MRDDPATRVRENITGITTMLVTGLWLALMFTEIGGDLWLPVLLVGYIVVIPLVALVFGDEADKEEWWDDWWGDESWDEWWGEESDSSTDDESEEPDRRPGRKATTEPNNREALETLRARYAAGELTDEQFERKLERLLETETLEDVAQYHESDSDPTGHAREDVRADDRNGNRDLGYETE